MIPTNDNAHVRRFVSMDEAFAALALDCCMVFLLKKEPGRGWVLQTRGAKR